LLRRRRRQRRAFLPDQARQALRHVDHLPALWQGQVDLREHHCKQQADEKRQDQRLAEALVVFAASGPGHDGLAVGQGARFPLDHPVELAPLLLPLLLEHVFLEKLAVLLLVPDLLGERLPSVLDFI
jgi:hypothetical protein